LRIFILRLEDGEQLPDTLLNFCRTHKIIHGLAFFLGGVRRGSRLVSGPGREEPPFNPIIQSLTATHEILGLGTVLPNEQGEPTLHAHAAAGRKRQSRVGCIRPGIKIWHIVEIVLLELAPTNATRSKDPLTGFNLLKIE